MGSKSTEKRDWEKVVAEYEGGDEAQEDFCLRRRINVWSFRYHLYEIRRNVESGRHRSKGQTVRFVEVKPQPAAMCCAGLRIKLGAVTVELDRTPPAEWVAELAKSYSE